ncbi:hypothetical protein JXA40_03525 [bacterium]|nr:hypothetical protein [candidate division CSSED10-310 bacterium]
MKNMYCVFAAFCLIVLAGCGPSKQPAEPTPDVQAQLRTPLELSDWFTDLRFLFFKTVQALEVIDNRLGATLADTNRSDIRNLIDYFNEPGKVADLLNSQHALLKTKEKMLADQPGLNPNIYKNLSDMNTITGELVGLVSKYPENPPVFRENMERLKSEFLSIEKLLHPEFPNSDANLAGRKSPESPDLRRFTQVLTQVPQLKPAETTTPVVAEETTEVEPEEEYTEPKMWRDRAGNIHVGQNPPEGVRIIEVSEPPPISIQSQPEPETEPDDTEITPTPLPAPASSLIWTDAQGRVHMGTEAPADAQTRKAEDISIILID